MSTSNVLNEEQVTTDQEFEDWLNSLGPTDKCGSSSSCPVRWFLINKKGWGNVGVHNTKYANPLSTYDGTTVPIGSTPGFYVNGTIGSYPLPKALRKLPALVDPYVSQHFSFNMGLGWNLLTPDELRALWAEAKSV